MRKFKIDGPNHQPATLPILSDYDPDNVRNWIKAICEAAGISTTGLAREADFPPATINRFVNKTVGAQRNLNVATIEKLKRTAVKLLSPERSKQHDHDVLRKGWTTRTIEVLGPVTLSRRETPEWASNERFLWQAPIEHGYARHFVIGLQVEDDSVDLLYPKGSLVTATRYAELMRLPRNGERVVLHRDLEGGVEVTIREYHIDGDGEAWLLSRSSKPHVNNINLGKHGECLPKALAIPFRVTASFTPE